MNNFFSFIILITSSFCFAQNKNSENLNKQLDSIIFRLNINIDTASDVLKSVKEAVQTMDRVSKTQKNWSVEYFSTYFNFLTYFYLQKDQKEAYKNRVNTLLLTLEENSKSDIEKSETLALKGFFIMQIINENPSVNGPKLSALVSKYFNESLKYNSENPRAIYLHSLFKTGLSEFFGEKKYYCTDNTIANKFFIKELVNKKNNLYPLWGAEQNSFILENCINQNMK